MNEWLEHLRRASEEIDWLIDNCCCDEFGEKCRTCRLCQIQRDIEREKQIAESEDDSRTLADTGLKIRYQKGGK